MLSRGEDYRLSLSSFCESAPAGVATGSLPFPEHGRPGAFAICPYWLYPGVYEPWDRSAGRSEALCGKAIHRTNISPL